MSKTPDGETTSKESIRSRSRKLVYQLRRLRARKTASAPVASSTRVEALPAKEKKPSKKTHAEKPDRKLLEQIEDLETQKGVLEEKAAILQEKAATLEQHTGALEEKVATLEQEN
ncbi:MAG: hypothetical protein V2A74_10575, partial [bacterium]